MGKSGRNFGAKTVLKLKGADMKGSRNGEVVSPKASGKKSNCVYVTNLHRGARAIDLCLIFQDCGFIKNVQVPHQQDIVDLKEAAVVTFRDKSSVESALAKTTGNKIRGVRVAVHRENPID